MNGEGLAVNPLCGDEVEIQLRLGAERQIQQAAFLGRGCAVSQGAASLVCERVEGVDVASVLALSSAEVLSWMGVTLSPIRQRCASLALEALQAALRVPAQARVRLAILDRDDTLIRLPEGTRYVCGDDPIELMPGAAEFIRRCNAAGVPVVVATNQQGISLADYPDMTTSAVDQVHRRLQAQFHDHDARIDRFYICPHSAAMQCGCRKPEPGLFRQALWDFDVLPAEAVVIGDRPTDLQAAAAAGIERRFLLRPVSDGFDGQAAEGARVVRFFDEIRQQLFGSYPSSEPSTPAPIVVEQVTAQHPDAESNAAPHPLIPRFLRSIPKDLPDEPMILDIGSFTPAADPIPWDMAGGRASWRINTIQ